MPAQVYQPS